MSHRLFMGSLLFRLSVALLVSLWLLGALPVRAADYYVSPEGSANATGAFDDPWTLAKALNNPTFIRAGDTIWMRGGIYRGAFTSRLMGAPDLPVTVRGYPGERAVIDGRGNSHKVATLRVDGSWTWYRDFEITNSDSHTFGWARSHSIEIYGPHTKIINLVIYNTGQGPGLWTQAVDSEIYGCIVFSNGWLAGRGHGHGTYTQNNTGLKQIRDSMFFNQFGYNFHAYGSSNSRLNHYVVSGNVFFNGNFLVGGNTPAEDIRIQSNSYYRSSVELGYGNPYNKNLMLLDNTIGGDIVAQWWEGAKIAGNTIFPVDQTSQSCSIAVHLRSAGGKEDYEIDRNVYYRGPKRDGHDFYFRNQSGAYTIRFPGWQTLGYDINSAYLDSPNRRPSENRVTLKRNEYDGNRGHLVVYNWLGLDEVQVDLSELEIQPGDKYEIRNVQNYFDEAISGTYDSGRVTLPMTIWSGAKPVMMFYEKSGETKAISQPSTFPEFGAFVVTRQPARR